MEALARKTALFCLIAAGAAALLPACDGGGDGTGGGGAGPTGGAGGGETGKPDGSACSANGECANGFCLTQAEFGFPYGYCTGACNKFVACDAGSACSSAFLNEPFCYTTCGSTADCGAGQQCLEVDSEAGTKVCGQGCTMDSECEGFGVCNEGSGRCVIPEDCDLEGDEDGNGLADCEDADCAMKCQAEIDMVCGAAVSISPSGVQMGDNGDGSSLLSGTCSGSGNNEDVYTIAIPDAADAVLDITLSSGADLALWAASTCGMPSELGCVDALPGGGEPERLAISVSKGQTVFVVVDGSSLNGATGNQGSYTLTTALLPLQPETEPNDDLMSANAVTLDVLPTVAAGELDQAMDDDDWFVIDTSGLGGPKTITAETIGVDGSRCAPSGDVDTYLEIVSDAGVVLDPPDAMDAGENEDIGGSNRCSLAQLAGAPAGTYYLHVKTSAACVPDPNGPDCAFKYGIKLQIQ